MRRKTINKWNVKRCFDCNRILNQHSEKTYCKSCCRTNKHCKICGKIMQRRKTYPTNYCFRCKTKYEFKINN